MAITILLACRGRLYRPLGSYSSSLIYTISGLLLRQLMVILGAFCLLFTTPIFAQEAPVADENSAVQFYVEDIKSTMQTYITRQLDADGVFHLLDDKTDEVLALKFIMVHDPVRQIEGNIYFACTDFHVVGKPDKIYDLDFWMNGEAGELNVYDNKVHKEPRWSLFYGWYKHPRYTFVNDKIEYLY
jgi:hypothetical protein